MNHWSRKILACLFLLGSLASNGYGGDLCDAPHQECQARCDKLKTDKKTAASYPACTKACTAAKSGCDISVSHKASHNNSCRDGFDDCQKACGLFPDSTWGSTFFPFVGDKDCNKGCYSWSQKCKFTAEQLNSKLPENLGCTNALEQCEASCQSLSGEELYYLCSDVCYSVRDSCYATPQKTEKCKVWQSRCTSDCRNQGLGPPCTRGCSEGYKDCIATKTAEA